MTFLAIVLGICLLLMWISNRNLTNERDFYKAKAVNTVKRQKGRGAVSATNKLTREFYKVNK